MALWRQGGLDQINKVPDQSRRLGDYLLLQRTSRSMHQRSCRSVSLIQQQLSDQSTHQCHLHPENKEAIKSNRLRCQEIECTINKEELKKDRTKKKSHLDHQDDRTSISKKLNQQIGGSLGNVHPFHQFGKYRNGSVQAHPSI